MGRDDSVSRSRKHLFKSQTPSLWGKALWSLAFLWRKLNFNTELLEKTLFLLFRWLWLLRASKAVRMLFRLPFTWVPSNTSKLPGCPFSSCLIGVKVMQLADFPHTLSKWRSRCAAAIATLTLLSRPFCCFRCKFFVLYLASSSFLSPTYTKSLVVTRMDCAFGCTTALNCKVQTCCV